MWKKRQTQHIYYEYISIILYIHLSITIYVHICQLSYTESKVCGGFKWGTLWPCFLNKPSKKGSCTTNWQKPNSLGPCRIPNSYQSISPKILDFKAVSKILLHTFSSPKNTSHSSLEALGSNWTSFNEEQTQKLDDNINSQRHSTKKL